MNFSSLPPVRPPACLSLPLSAHFNLDTASFRNKSQEVSSELVLSSCNYKWKLMISFDTTQFQMGLRRIDESTHSVQILLVIKINNSNSYNGFYGNNGVNFVNQKYNLCLTKDQKEIFSNKIQRGALFNSVLEGTISLSCDCQSNQIKSKENTIAENVAELQNDIHLLLEKKMFSDVILKVGNSRIPAHKLILSSRSPVFCKMFENNMKENKNGCVDIVDTKVLTIRNFLTFIYRGVLEDTKYETVYALYTTADKYDVPTLMDTCRMYLDSYISLTTVLDILQLADLHDDKALKENCSNFICENFEQIELKHEWNSILDKNPRVASYVLRNVSRKFSKPAKIAKLDI